MSNQDISTVLKLIDEWVQQLGETSLRDQSRRSGMDFFAYMQSRGEYGGYLATLVKNSLGYHPRQVHRQADAETLREAIFNYEASVEVAKDEGRGGQSWKRFWGQS